MCATATCTDAPAINASNTGYTATADLSTRTYDLPVTPGASVAWYVRARNSGGTQSAASTRHYFVVNGTTGAAAVTLSWPNNGATVYTLTPTLTWYLSGSSAGVSGYQVCFGTAATSAGNASCSTPATVSGATTTSYTIPSGQLAYGTTYYWFVRDRRHDIASTSFVTTGERWRRSAGGLVAQQ